MFSNKICQQKLLFSSKQPDPLAHLSAHMSTWAFNGSTKSSHFST